MNDKHVEPLQELSKSCNNASSIIVSGKTAQFALLLERCKAARLNLPTTTASSPSSSRDALQALLANLHFTDLLDALEVLFVERVQLERVFKRCSPIESVDDIEVIEQYLVGLQQTVQKAKEEIRRLAMSDSREACAIDRSVETNVLIDRSSELNGRLINEVRDLREAVKMETEKRVKMAEEYEGKIANYKSEISSFKTRLSLVQEELGKSEGREEDRVQELAYLKNELEKSLQVKSRTEQTISASFESRISQLEGQIEHSERESAEHKNKIAELKNQIRMLDGQLKEKSEEIAAITTEHLSNKHNSSGRAQELEREVESTRRTLVIAKEELLSSRSQLQQAKTQLTNQEYLKNVILSFLTIPSQRQYMLRVICDILKLSDDERRRISI